MSKNNSLIYFISGLGTQLGPSSKPNDTVPENATERAEIGDIWTVLET